jgi:hypothetical protein
MALLVSCSEKEPVGMGQKLLAIGGRKRDGTCWKTSVEDAIREIESGTQTYYVNVNGFTPNLVVAMHKDGKYLKAPFDRDIPATLLGLPDC